MLMCVRVVAAVVVGIGALRSRAPRQLPARPLERPARLPPSSIQMLELGSLEFVDLWRDPPSTFVRMVTKPKFGAWVPKAVQRQLAAGTVE